MAKAKILFADNDPDFLETRREFLEKAGLVVIPAASPEEARKKLVAENPDVAILDIRLLNDDDEKDISGLEFAKEIGRLVPVLLLTGYASLEYARQALKPQLDGLPAAYDFIAKQDGPEIMLTAVRNTLEVVAKTRQRAITQNPSLQVPVTKFVNLPNVIGRAILDLLGRDKASDSTATLLGYAIITIIILGLLGIVDFDRLVSWFAAWWRFFFPVK